MGAAFINITQDNPKQDAATQRRVRVEVMRDFRSRQRARNAVKYTAHSALVTRPTTPAVLCGDNRVSLRNNTRKATLLGTSKNTPKDASAAVATKSTSEEDDLHCEGHVTVIPYILHLSATDRMVSVYAELSGTRPGIDVFHQNGLFASSVCLYALGLRPSVLRDKSVLLFKAHALRQANERLRDPQTALSEVTVELLCNLAVYEQCQGSFEAMIHLEGIGKIIALRGGIEKLGHEGVTEIKITYLDMILSVVNNRAPVFTILDEPSTQSSADLTFDGANIDQHSHIQWWNMSNNFIRFSPLLRFPHYELCYNKLSILPSSIFRIVESMMCLTEHFFSYEGPRTLCSRCRDSVRQLNEEPSKGDYHATSETMNHENACRLAAFLYSRALLDLVPFNHTSNAEAAEGLHAALIQIGSDFVLKLPFVHLWLALVNAASKPSHLFAINITKVYRVVNFPSFNNARKILSNVLWIQKRIRGEPWPFADSFTPKQQEALRRITEYRDTQRRALQARQAQMSLVGLWDKHMEPLRLMIEQEGAPHSRIADSRAAWSRITEVAPSDLENEIRPE